MGSKVAKIIRWIVRIIIFILVLLLIINNLHKVPFNFYGIYNGELPLIVLIISSVIIGFVVGITYGFINSLELRSRIKLLRKDLEELRKPVSTPGN